MNRILGDWPPGKPIKIIRGKEEVYVRTNPGQNRKLTALVQEGASRLGERIDKKKVVEMIKQGNLEDGSLVLTIHDTKP